MTIKMNPGLVLISLALALPCSVAAQSAADGQARRAPSKAVRSYVVESARSLNDLERKLGTENRAEDLLGGEGLQLRVAVQHEANKGGAAAELHDASDDVYYVLDGTATLILGGTLDAPTEVEPGEWRSPRILDGKTVEISRGDLVVVPRGTPHQRSTVGKDFSMILIKVFAEPIRAPQQTQPPTKARRP